MNMSSKSTEYQSMETQAASAPQEGAGKTSATDSPRLEQIRIRAHEIYLERGGQPGHDLDDWIQAERDLEPKVWPAQAGQ
jgi:hypothetical protein